MRIVEVDSQNQFDPIMFCLYLSMKWPTFVELSFFQPYFTVSYLQLIFSYKNKNKLEAPIDFNRFWPNPFCWVIGEYLTFFAVCDFPWTLSRSVGMVFHHYLWPQVPQLTHPLRHTWPEVVMGNHTHTSAVHRKSFHKGLTKRSLHPILCTKMYQFLMFCVIMCQKEFKN